MSVSLDLEYLKYVARDPCATVRGNLARQLAACAGDPATPEDEVSAIEPLLLRLADDVVGAVRQALAEQLLVVTRPPRAVLFALIGDVEEISVPLLTRAAGFTARDLAAIVRHGDVVRQGAIARRKGLPREVCAAICDSTCAVVCGALLDNATAAVEPSHLRTLSSRFADQADIRDRLLARAELPADLRVALICAIGGAVAGMQADDRVRDGRFAGDTTLADREWVILDIAGAANGRDLAVIIAQLHDSNRLTGTMLARAACAGDLRFLSVSLGLLAGMPARRVGQLLVSLGATGCEAVCAKTDLGGTLRSLLAVACEIHGEIGEQVEAVDPDTFTRSMIEYVMTNTLEYTAAQHDALLRVFAACGAGEARSVARQIIDVGETLAA